MMRREIKQKATDANGNSTSYTYDTQGNILTMTDPLNQTTTWTWSSDFDRILSVKDPKGAVTTLSYDAAGHLTGITEPGKPFIYRFLCGKRRYFDEHRSHREFVPIYL